MCELQCWHWSEQAAWEGQITDETFSKCGLREIRRCVWEPEEGVQEPLLCQCIFCKRSHHTQWLTLICYFFKAKRQQPCLITTVKLTTLELNKYIISVNYYIFGQVDQNQEMPSSPHNYNVDQASSASKLKDDNVTQVYVTSCCQMKTKPSGLY